jgi:hypothetical protein
MNQHSQQRLSRSGTYYARRGETTIGPVNLEQLALSVIAGTLTSHDGVSTSPSGPWREVIRIAGLAKLIDLPCGQVFDKPEWYYENDSNVVGPMALSRLQARLAVGLAPGTVRVRCGESGPWQSVEQVPVLRGLAAATLPESSSSVALGQELDESSIELILLDAEQRAARSSQFMLGKSSPRRSPGP